MKGVTKMEIAIGQTMVVHPLDARDLQKKNKKLQDRSFPQHEEPVQPKNKTKQVKKMTQPTPEGIAVKIKKQKEYKPW
jgi:hypothetical protein